MKTLNRLIPAFALMLFSFSLQAQTTFGVRGGINIANWRVKTISTGNSFSFDNTVVFTYGGLVNIGISNNFGIQPEIYFIQKGFSDEFTGNSSLKFIVNYLEVPIYARYHFGKGKLSGFILGGPTLGYGLSAKQKDCFSGSCYTSDIELTESSKRVDFGLSLGGGIMLHNSLFLDIRYVLGITDLNSNDNATRKNLGLNIGLGYIFRGSRNKK